MHCVLQTSDGGYVLGGRSISDPGTGTKTAPAYRNYDYYLVRVDANGNQLWDRTYGGTQYDRMASVLQTSDGGFLMAGYSESANDGNKTAAPYGPRDYWVIRVDANGNKLWERTYGGTGGETMHVARATADGGFILGGTSNSSTSGNKTSENYGWNSQDFWIVKIDANGNILWNRTFGSASEDFLHSVEVTSDGGYIIGGTSQAGASGNKTSDNHGGPDYWIIRLDGNGNKIWEQTYGGYGTDDLFGAVPTADGGYLLGGYSDSPPSGNKTAVGFGGYDVWVVRVDSLGNKLWDRSFGGDGNDNFMDTFTMHGLADGGFVFGTGTGGASSGGNKSAPNWGAVDMWYVRLDAAGNKLWDLSFGAGDTDVLSTHQMTADGGFILGGQSYSDVGGNKTAARQGGADFYVIKLGSSNVPGNTPPTVSPVANQVIDEDHSTGAIPFIIDDSETPAASLSVGAHSANQALLPDNRITLGGGGANRTLTLAPLPNQSGSAQITITVGDGQGGMSTNSFLLTVQPVNDPPVIDLILDQEVSKNAMNAPVSLVVGDVETPAGNLVVTASSSNPSLIPPGGLSVQGNTANRTLLITPAANQVGAAVITVTVSDGQLSASTMFNVSVQEVVLPPANLISHWKLDETSGASALDVTGRNPGVLVNGPERLAGKLGYALRFNGLNNYVNIPDSDSLDLGTHLTISFWFKPSQLLNSSTGRKDLFKKFISYWLIMNYPVNDGRLAFILNSGSSVVSSTTTQWLPDQWYHVAATYDGAVMRLYINGTLESSKTASTSPAVNSYPVQIGGNSEQGIFFPGLIDEVRLYSSTLGASEVGALAGVMQTPNALPQISALGDQAMNEDAAGLDLAFTVDDAETPAANLTLSVSSSNTTLFATTGLILGGSGANRTLRLIPALNQFGVTEVSVTVRDENGGAATSRFRVTVQSVNDAPALTAVSDQTIEQDQSTGPLNFSVSDVETAAAQLTVRGESSDQSLVANAGIVFGGSGAQRTVNVTPVAGRAGSTQITVYVSDGQLERSVSFQLIVVAVGPPGAETVYVTSAVVGRARNDFTGWVGSRITVGTKPIQVTALARYAFSGDSESHVVKIARASDGTDVPGATAAISMVGAPSGQWKFGVLPNPVTLLAGQAYYVISAERLGGDRFADVNSTVQTTDAAVENGGVYAVNSPGYVNVGGGGLTYGPPNFRYQRAGAAPVPTAAFQSPSEGAIFTLPTNITMVVNISAGVTNVDFYQDGAFLGRDTHHPASFVWASPGAGHHILTARGTDTNGTMAATEPINITVQNASAPPSGEAQAFVVEKVLGEVRNDFNGWIGFKLTIGSQALIVSELGRIIAPGNNGTHLVKLVRASDLADLPNGSVTINTAGGVPGQFKYGALPAAVTLAANTMYYLVSQEVLGGDRWHGVVGTQLTTRNSASVNSGVFMGSGYGWALAGTAAHSYGPVDFKFVVAPGGGGEDGVATVAQAFDRGGPALRTRIRHGHVLIDVRGVAAQRVLIEASDDLIHWVRIAEHVLERDEVSISDIEAGQRQFRFYRANQ